MNDWKKYSALFSLYIAQSVPMSFFSTVVPVIMRQESYSLESIGLLQLVKLPWIFKFLWAPLVDNKTGSSHDLRRWIIFSELFYAVVIVAIGLLKLETDFTLIVILLVVAFIASATQDIATDAMAILHLKPRERSVGNSMQSAGMFLGSLLGTGVLLIAYHYWGWSMLLFILASFVLFALLPLSFFRKKHSLVKTATKKASLSDIASFFRQRAMGHWTLVLALYYSGLIGILAMLKPYMVDLGYNVKEIGFYSGIVGTAVAAAVSFTGGFVVRRTGRRLPFLVFSALNILVGLFFVVFATTNPSTAIIVTGICLLWGAYGLSTIIIYTLAMDNVRPGREGTDFTLQIVISHLSGIIIAIMSGKVGDILGFGGIFRIEVLLSVVAFVVVLGYVKKFPEKWILKSKKDEFSETLN